MIGRQNRWQGTLFITGSLDQLIPDDHVLKRVEKVLDLSWLREEVKDCYCEHNGRPGIDPAAALRLMLAGFFQGIVHDRKLMREAQVNLAIRWFAGFAFDEPLPDHSSLTRIRQRWGVERFKKIFEKTVEACVRANLVSGETLHVDATLIRADVSWESLTTKHAEEVIAANDSGPDGEPPPAKKRGRPCTKPQYPKKKSTTDPDATMATGHKKVRLEPSYKQHTAVDDHAGVVVDVELTTGEAAEGGRLVEAVERVEETTGIKVERVTGDAAYAHPTNYEKLEQRGTDAIMPPSRASYRRRAIPLFRFTYDGKHKTVRCPGGKFMHRSGRGKNGWRYRAKVSACKACALRKRCIPPSAQMRTVCIVDGYEALLRARRRKGRGWDEEARQWYRRHRWRVEGVHGEGKTQHGLRRAARRGLDNVAMQVYLTAAVMNLEAPGGAFAAFLAGMEVNIEGIGPL